MYKLLALIAILTVILACNNAGSNTNSGNKGQNEDLPKSTGPDASDLLKTLQGRWKSDQDSTYILEIIDTRMRHINNGNLTAETEIEVDGGCVTQPCKIDTTDLTDGWCFMERGQHDAQCNIVISCDKECLKYRAIGASNPVLVFKKQ